jgi:signal transduction histidine kinase
MIAITAPEKEIYAEVYSLRNVLIIVVLLTIVLSVLIAWYLSRSISAPIEELIAKLNTNKDGYLETLKMNSGTAEINTLISHYNDFASQQNKLTENIKQTEQKLREEKEKAENSDRLKTQFLNNLSHEIRTPLNAINGFAEIITGQEYSEKEKQEFSKYISVNTEILNQLIDDTIHLSKLELNQISVSHSTISINNLIDNLLDAFILKSSEKITLTTRKPLEPQYIESDNKLLSDILYRLLDNAFKFTKKGTIELGFERINGQNTFWVKDTGIGMDAMTQQNIFENFSQHDSFKQGFGLGLAICRQLIALLKGKIWVESSLKTGSTFYVNIP